MKVDRRTIPKPIRGRFFAKVDKNGPVSEYAPKLGPCWLWTGTSCAGYGICSFPAKSLSKAHRVSYELLVGPIPEGYQVDHLCLVKRCVNPTHLEAVTPSENMRRMWAARRWGKT